MVISIGNGVLKGNDPNSLSEFGGGITLTDNWFRGVLKSMDWAKRKATTGKFETSAQFLAEEQFTFQIASGQWSIPMTSLLTLSSTLIKYLFHTYPLESTHSTLKVLKTFPYEALLTIVKLLLHFQTVQPVNFYQCN